MLHRARGSSFSPLVKSFVERPKVGFLQKISERLPTDLGNGLAQGTIPL